MLSKDLSRTLKTELLTRVVIWGALRKIMLLLIPPNALPKLRTRVFFIKKNRAIFCIFAKM